MDPRSSLVAVVNTNTGDRTREDESSKTVLAHLKNRRDKNNTLKLCSFSPYTKSNNIGRQALLISKIIQTTFNAKNARFRLT